MLNLVRHLIKSIGYETLKQVQGDISGLLEQPPAPFSIIDIAVISPAFKKIDIFEPQEIISKAHHRVGEPFEPIGLTPDQLKEKKGVVREIVNNGIVIYAK